MQKLAEICIRRPVFATMLILALVVVGAASWMQPCPSIAFLRSTFRASASARPCPARPPKKPKFRSRSASKRPSTRRGPQRAALGVGRPASRMVLPTFELWRDIDAAAQDVRDRVAAALGDLPRDTRPPLIAKIRQRLRADPHDRRLRRSHAARADRNRRQDRQPRARALERRRRSRSRRRARARHQHLGRCRPAGRLPACRSPRCDPRSRGRTRICPAATSPSNDDRADAAHARPRHRSARTSTIW